MLTNLRDESLFSSLRSDHHNNQSTNQQGTTKFGRFPKNLPEEYIKKRVASQLSQNRAPNLLNSTTATKTSSKAESNPRIASLKKLKIKENEQQSNNQHTTDYISLNRRMQLLSRTMGKEANMGQSSFRKHNDGIMNASFPLTQLKEDQISSLANSRP